MRMMKKLICSLLFIAVTVCLSGCIRVKVDITVKKNGKADITMLYAAQEALASMTDSEDTIFSMTPEKAEEYRKDGWDVAEYAEDGYTGYILSQKNADLSKASLTEDAEGSLRKEGSLYIVDFDPLSEEDRENLSVYGPFIKSSDGYMTIRITLPVKPEKHNATSVSEDGMTLEWDLLEMKEPIHVEVKLPNVIPWIVAGLLAAAAAVFLIFRKQNKKGQSPPSGSSGSELTEETQLNAVEAETADEYDELKQEDTAQDQS